MPAFTSLTKDDPTKSHTQTHKGVYTMSSCLDHSDSKFLLVTETQSMSGLYQGDQGKNSSIFGDYSPMTISSDLLVSTDIASLYPLLAIALLAAFAMGANNSQATTCPVAKPFKIIVPNLCCAFNFESPGCRAMPKLA